MEHNQMIDLALVGAQKCGTTTLAALLGQHPSVCVAKNKEAHLFDQEQVQRNGVDSLAFLQHFPHSKPGQILVDATPSYFYLPGCLESLIQHNPKIRILVVLRDPAERAVSHHAHERRLGFERHSFPISLLLERIRLRKDRNPLASDSAHRHFSYLDRGRYVIQMQRLSSLSENFYIIWLTDLLTNPQGVMNHVFEFLDLHPIVIDEVPRLNARQDQPRGWHIMLARLFFIRSTQQLGLNDNYPNKGVK